MTLSEEQKREVARRLENWAQWHNSGCVGPRKIVGAPFPAYNLVNIAGRDDPNNLINVGDAEDTDRIVRGMHPEHVRALIVHYLWSPTFTPRARARACKTSVATYYRRVARAETIFNGLVYRKQRPKSIDQMIKGA